MDRFQTLGEPKLNALPYHEIGENQLHVLHTDCPPLLHTCCYLPGSDWRSRQLNSSDNPHTPPTRPSPSLLHTYCYLLRPLRNEILTWESQIPPPPPTQWHNSVTFNLYKKQVIFQRAFQKYCRINYTPSEAILIYCQIRQIY